MLLVNWGRDVKKIANGALTRCEHCKNITVYEICESYIHVGAFFIKLAKFKKKYTMACPVCRYGYEIDPSKIDQVLRDTINVPSCEEVQPIMAAIEREAEKDRHETGDEKLLETLDNWRDDLVARVTREGHPPERVKYVAEFWANDILQAMVGAVRKQLGKEQQ